MQSAGGPDRAGAPWWDRVEECPHRGAVRGTARTETARCDLLQKIAGVKDPRLARVARDACEACCRAPVPREDHLNPVISSLLFGLAGRVLERKGVPGCGSRRAARLLRLAREGLRVELGDPPPDLEALRRRGMAHECRHLGPALRGGSASEIRFRCLHPAHRETTESSCRVCRDWSGDSRTASHVLPGIPRPWPRRGPRVRRWAVGITTAPRRMPTLDICLDSVLRAGWDRPRIFADGRLELLERHRHLPVTQRQGQAGAWPNFLLSLMELLLREPEADAYLLLQDDSLLHDREDLRAYLEGMLWPAPAVGMVSLYCPRPYTRPAAGWHVFEGKWVWGALALIFPRESARRFIADREVLEHRWSRVFGGLAQIDVVAGSWAARNRLAVCFPTPSLAQHIGEVSSIWPGVGAYGSRRADRFAGDMP